MSCILIILTIVRIIIVVIIDFIYTCEQLDKVLFLSPKYH